MLWALATSEMSTLANNTIAVLGATPEPLN